MRLLLDTNAFLWAAAEPSSLSSRARELLSDPRNDLLLSAASAWEIAIKARLGRLKLASPAERFVPAQMSALDIAALPILHVHTLRTGRLPLHHRDPFDRLLVAQAQTEQLPIVSSDDAFDEYGITRLW